MVSPGDACSVSDAKQSRLRELAPDLPAVPAPLETAGLDEEPLYDSERDYLDQNDYYQARKEER